MRLVSIAAHVVHCARHVPRFLRILDRVACAFVDGEIARRCGNCEGLGFVWTIRDKRNRRRMKPCVNCNGRGVVCHAGLL